jgi:hypothetical protein
VRQFKNQRSETSPRIPSPILCGIDRGLVIDWGKQHCNSIQGTDLIMELKDIDPIYVVSFDF